jgi:hypothetical protein
MDGPNANKFERVRFEKEIWLVDSPPLVIGCKKCVGIKKSAFKTSLRCFKTPIKFSLTDTNDPGEISTFLKLH